MIRKIKDFKCWGVVCCLLFKCNIHSGSLKRIYYSNLYSLAHPLSLNISTALKGTHFYVLLITSVGKRDTVFLLSMTCNSFVAVRRSLLDIYIREQSSGQAVDMQRQWCII